MKQAASRGVSLPSSATPSSTMDGNDAVDNDSVRGYSLEQQRRMGIVASSYPTMPADDDSHRGYVAGSISTLGTTQNPY